jgi:hypothetical protein
MRRVFEFISETTGSRVIRSFLNEINESESTFTELSQDSESIIVDLEPLDLEKNQLMCKSKKSNRIIKNLMKNQF